MKFDALQLDLAPYIPAKIPDVTAQSELLMLLYYHPSSPEGHSTKKKGHDSWGQVVAQPA